MPHFPTTPLCLIRWPGDALTVMLSLSKHATASRVEACQSDRLAVLPVMLSLSKHATASRVEAYQSDRLAVLPVMLSLSKHGGSETHISHPHGCSDVRDRQNVHWSRTR